MLITNKETGRVSELDLEHITLESIKEASNFVSEPSQSMTERDLEVSFPIIQTIPNDISRKALYEVNKLNRVSLNEETKLYEILVEIVTANLEAINRTEGLLLLGTDKSIENNISIKNLEMKAIKLTEVFVEGVGNLKIITPYGKSNNI